MVWPHGQEELDCFCEHLNRPHLKIKFTVEVEKNNKLAYLNVHVTRSDTKLSTCAYLKPTHTKPYIHFHSYHYTGMAMGMLRRK